MWRLHFDTKRNYSRTILLWGASSAYYLAPGLARKLFVTPRVATYRYPVELWKMVRAATTLRQASYPALDLACGDVRNFMLVMAGTGAILISAGLYATVNVSGLFASTIVFAYFPFASAFILSQHFISLRMMKAEYGDATPDRRREIGTEVHRYQQMMIAGGLTVPVVGLVKALVSLQKPAKEGAPS